MSVFRSTAEGRSPFGKIREFRRRRPGRPGILLESHSQRMILLPDWREFIELLNSQKVDYVIVGTWARALHGVPRSTGDIDFFVRASPENANRLVKVLAQFGFASLGISRDDFLTPGQIIQLGIDPYRIDLIELAALSPQQAGRRAPEGPGGLGRNSRGVASAPYRHAASLLLL